MIAFLLIVIPNLFRNPLILLIPCKKN